MPLTNGCAVLNLKINGYLKFYFFNGWNKLLIEWLELEHAHPHLRELL